MKTERLLKKLKKEKLPIIIDMSINIMEIEELLNNFRILYGIDVELNFRKPIKAEGRWLDGSIAEKLLPFQK